MSLTQGGIIAPPCLHALRHLCTQCVLCIISSCYDAKHLLGTNQSACRHMPPNFYYNMQDYMVERQAHGALWTWSSLRPNPVAGVSRGSYMNITVSIALYAVICKELDLPLRSHRWCCMLSGRLVASHCLRN